MFSLSRFLHGDRARDAPRGPAPFHGSDPYPEEVSKVPTTAALIPVKAFKTAKSRLQGALGDAERETLSRQLATGVVTACASIAPHVVCEDPSIVSWARDLGAEVIEPPESGLNTVIRYGVSWLADAGFDRVLVTHADLADPSGLAALADIGGVVLVPDRAKDGTNVVVVPTTIGFRFSYGPNSFARHLSEAERVGLAIHVVDDPGLALDVDDADDLDAYSSANPGWLRSVLAP